VLFAAEDSWRGASNEGYHPGSAESRLWKLEGGRESWLRSNCMTTLVKWSDCGDLLEVKSGMTAIAGGVVSSTELFSYAEHQSGSRRRSTNVCELRQVVRQQACRPFPPL